VQPTVIAIDGPAGSGKSTLARALALELGLPYIDTGLMYRALALRALQEGIDPEDDETLATAAADLTFELDPGGHPPELLVDGSPPDPALRAEAVEAIVSRVARHVAVRSRLRDEQRRLGSAGAVMEGRDIGSVVFPTATLRVVLEAHPEERATRRAVERDADLPVVGDAIARRDEQDALNVPALEPDLVVDTTPLDARSVLEVVLAAARERLREAR
jgi:cytidylate kinase